MSVQLQALHKDYKPCHDRTTGKTFLRPDDGKCLHDYFYVMVVLTAYPMTADKSVTANFR